MQTPSADSLRLLVGRLVDPTARWAVARELAAHLGADDLLVFIPDAETGTLLPAPGFPQTLPRGREWRTFLAVCVTTAAHAAQLPFPTVAMQRPAYGIAAGGAVLVLLGGQPPYPGLVELRALLPLLAAAFRGEQQAVLARGQANAAQAASAQAQALAAALDATRRELQDALEQTAAALQVRDQFLGSVSHDLRNPLTTILGQSQLLLRQASRGPSVESSRVAKALGTVEAAATQMAGMIDELLDLTRLESGRPLELRLEACDAVALVRQVAELQQGGTAGHQLRVEAAMPALPVEWDGARMQRVLANVLSNAVKYSPEGGTVTVALTTEERSQQEWLRLTVQDQGMGIPAADLPHIFERFHRAANVRGRITGIGLGLAGAKQIVEQHGGTITVASEEGAGTRVTVQLPCAALGHRG